MSSHHSRSSRVRTKVAALLISLVALWVFAAVVTLREGLNLLFVGTLDQGVAQPLETLVPAIQKERQVTLVYLGGRRDQQRVDMVAERTRTDAAVARFRELASGRGVSIARSDQLAEDLDLTFTRLAELTNVRNGVDGKGGTGTGTGNQRTDVAARYSEILDAIFVVYDSLGALDDKGLAADVRTLVALSRAHEVIAQEDALVSGALAAGAFASTDEDTVVQLIGTQRFLRREAAARLPEADRVKYTELIEGPAFTRFEAQETTLLESLRKTQRPTVTITEWSDTMKPVYAEYQVFILAAGDSLVDRSTPVAVWVIVRLALAGGLGLIAVIASIVISITTARALVRQLERLRNAAHDLASYRLPRVVERLQHGEKVDIETEAPALDFGRDEIGQVSQAFNAVQETAVRVAVEQAELRRNIRDVFLNLARRSQALLHRQLGLLDAMERRATDAEELAELFRIDHLATRMRRHAENLIVLSGATAGRAWRKPVPMIDVLRGALAEVEDYTRVNVQPTVPAALVGRAVGDVIHLLAELIENAVSFSPPQTTVTIGGSFVGNGFAIEIEDRGLGMTDEDRAVANQQLSDPPEFKLSSTARLGLYVVGKLAERHGIRVRLTASPYGGTTAIVLMPSALLADEAGDAGLDPSDADSVETSAKALTPGRHRYDGQLRPATITAVPAPAVALADKPHVIDAETTNGRYSPPPFVAPTVAPSLPKRRPSKRSGPSGPSGPGSPPAPAPGPGPGPGSPSGPLPQLPVRPGDSPLPRRPMPPVLTPSGLPFRQRDPQPSEPPPVPESPTRVGDEAASPRPEAPSTDLPDGERPGQKDPTVAAPRPERGREDVRSIMSSYRSGTLRGRVDAAQLAGTSHAPERAPQAQQPHSTDEEG